MTDAPKAPQKLLPPKKESPGMSLVSNALAIVGFIILIVIVVWGILHIVSLSKFSFGSFFTPSPAIEITVPTNALSGQPATISWKMTNGTKVGSFAFLYRCMENFSFNTLSQNGAMNRVPCGASINVGSSTSATMIPVVVGTRSISVPVSVVFISAKTGDRVEASATMTVAPGAQVVEATSTPVVVEKPAPVKKPATVYRKPAATGHYAPVPHAASGPADLSVRIIATGYIDPTSGALLMNRAPTPNDIVGVEFDIANVGGSSSGAWFFQAHLPTVGGYTYTSANQVSLAPGAHIVNTLRFTQLAPGGGMFTAIADPSNLINDTNHTNNEAAVTIY